MPLGIYYIIDLTGIFVCPEIMGDNSITVSLSAIAQEFEQLRYLARGWGHHISVAQMVASKLEGSLTFVRCSAWRVRKQMPKANSAHHIFLPRA